MSALKWVGERSGTSVSWHTESDEIGATSFQIEKTGRQWCLFKDGLFLSVHEDSASAKQACSKHLDPQKDR